MRVWVFFMAAPEISADREIEIGQRLREARKFLMISQTLFSMKAEISQPRLAKYELGGAPLPWAVGNLVCSVFGIDPIWLGTGTRTMFGGGWTLDDRMVNALGSRPRFSTVIDEIMLPLEKERPFSKRVRDAQPKSGEYPDQSARKFLQGIDTTLPTGRRVGPFLSTEQASAWNRLAFGPLRRAFSSVQDDHLVDFCKDLEGRIAEARRRFESPGQL